MQRLSARERAEQDKGSDCGGRGGRQAFCPFAPLAPPAARRSHLTAVSARPAQPDCGGTPELRVGRYAVAPFYTIAGGLRPPLSCIPSSKNRQIRLSNFDTLMPARPLPRTVSPNPPGAPPPSRPPRPSSAGDPASARSPGTGRARRASAPPSRRRRGSLILFTGQSSAA